MVGNGWSGVMSVHRSGPSTSVRTSLARLNVSADATVCSDISRSPDWISVSMGRATQGGRVPCFAQNLQITTSIVHSGYSLIAWAAGQRRPTPHVVPDGPALNGNGLER